jgi:hypothetical protein
MKDMSDDARGVLERGLAFDGPSEERRLRVKQRMLLSLAGGGLTLGGAASAASAGSAIAAAGVGAGTKGMLVGSLWAWFGVGVAAGIGLSGATAFLSLRSPPASVVPVTQPIVASPALGSRTTTGSVPASPLGVIDPSSRDAAVLVDQPGERRPAASGGTAPAPESALEPPTVPSPPAIPSTLSEEAALLQSAQRALAGKDPDQALLVLADHERRFANGALREERQVARILALCALGRVEGARALALAFVAASPRSLLIPRVQSSCVGDVTKPR